MSGSGVIILRPMAEQVSPAGCAPRRMRKTLYCVMVNPEGFNRCCMARCRQSAERIRLSSASSWGLEKLCACSDPWELAAIFPLLMVR
jgi:hypothetical protein